MDSLIVSRILSSSLVDDSTSIIIGGSSDSRATYFCGHVYDSGIAPYQGRPVKDFLWKKGNSLFIEIDEGGGLDG